MIVTTSGPSSGQVRSRSGARSPIGSDATPRSHQAEEVGARRVLDHDPRGPAGSVPVLSVRLLGSHGGQRPEPTPALAHGNPKSVFSLASDHLPKDGQPVAIMTIPSIGLHQAVVEGTSPADLQKGPGLVSTNGLSGLPGEEGTA